MSKEKLQVIELLDCTGKTAPQMTHELAELGGGNMADGLVVLWDDGRQNGIVSTTLVFAIGIGVYAFARNKITEIRTKRAIRAAAAERFDKTEGAEEVDSGSSTSVDSQTE